MSLHRRHQWALVLAAILAVGKSPQLEAQAAPPPAPTTKTPPKAVTPAAPTTRPPANTRASTGPGTGTQTEDDAYVGVKKQTVQGVNTPTTTKLPVRSGAGVSPNNGGGSTARDGGDDDLDDLEVERRTVQNVNRPILTKPVVKPSAGTSPNVGRAVAPGATPAPSPTQPGIPPKKP